jgi:hypothetical protein
MYPGHSSYLADILRVEHRPAGDDKGQAGIALGQAIVIVLVSAGP